MADVEIASIELVISAMSIDLDLEPTGADLEIVQVASIDLDLEAS